MVQLVCSIAKVELVRNVSIAMINDERAYTGDGQISLEEFKAWWNSAE